MQYGNSLNEITKIEQLNNLRNNDSIHYYAFRLCYLLTEFKKINHVVLIVDDIESIGFTLELVPIDIGLTLWSCLKNKGAHNVNQNIWSSCVIISCRHYVYRMIQKHSIEDRYVIQSGVNGQTLESYPIDDEINISKSLKLVDIIVKRIRALSEKRGDKRWNDAWYVVERILLKVDVQFGDFIMAISINNIRKALTLLKKVIFNKRWIQRTWVDPTPGAFSIDSIDQFNLSIPCLLRAVALEEGNIYTEDSVIPNIMTNTNDKDSDLITLIVLKAFINQSDEDTINWRVSLDRVLTVEKLKEVLDKKMHRYIDEAVEFLIYNRLLLRSKNQAQDDGGDITPQNIPLIKKFMYQKPVLHYGITWVSRVF